MRALYSWYYLHVLIILYSTVSKTITQVTGNEKHPSITENGSFSTKSSVERFVKDELDSNNDGLVSKNEMIDKIEESYKQQRENEIHELVKVYDMNQDRKISWKEFLSSAYPSEMTKNSRDLDYDEQRFKMADTDGDGYLDSTEFASFYFAKAENENLLEWTMTDWLNKVDLNRDGFVSMNEFLASQTEGNSDIRAERKLRQHFNEDYDINKDGKMDKKELREWLMPNRASAIVESGRILKSADHNGDGSLSLNEIIKNNESVLSVFQTSNLMYQNKDEL